MYRSVPFSASITHHPTCWRAALAMYWLSFHACIKELSASDRSGELCTPFSALHHSRTRESISIKHQVQNSLRNSLETVSTPPLPPRTPHPLPITPGYPLASFLLGHPLPFRGRRRATLAAQRLPRARSHSRGGRGRRRGHARCNRHRRRRQRKQQRRRRRRRSGVYYPRGQCSATHRVYRKLVC